MQNIITVKDLREKMPVYARLVQKGHAFIVFKRSHPLFRITPLADEQWEELVDFTKIKKGGVEIDELLARL